MDDRNTKMNVALAAIECPVVHSQKDTLAPAEFSFSCSVGGREGYAFLERENSFDKLGGVSNIAV